MRKTVNLYINEPGTTPVPIRCRVRNATKSVVVNGTLEDALLGRPADPFGCHLSNCAMRNANAFPHPCLMVFFTQNTCIIVEKNKGLDLWGVRYSHNYGRFVDMNDDGTIKDFAQRDPKAVERPFTLKPPVVRTQQEPGHHPSAGHEGGTTKRPYAVKGALRRAVKAGLISATVAELLTRQMHGHPKKKEDSNAANVSPQRKKKSDEK